MTLSAIPCSVRRARVDPEGPAFGPLRARLRCRDPELHRSAKPTYPWSQITRDAYFWVFASTSNLAGKFAVMRKIYEDHLAEEPAAQVELVKAGEIASVRKAALLCYEADAAVCHRRIVANLIVERTGVDVIDL